MIRFDTRDKKPKIYNTAILSAIALAVIIPMWINSETVPVWLTCAVCTVYVGIAIVMLMAAFFKQLQYNPYSYNTIFYLGLALFILSVFITLLVLLFMIIANPELYDVSYIASSLAGSPARFIILSGPTIIAFSIALVVSNISLLIHEVRRFRNVLGIILAFLLVGGLIFLYRADMYASGSPRDILVHSILINVFGSLYLYFECMVIGSAVGDVIAARYVPDPDKDFILILGCSIRKDGTPTPLLAGRIDKAVKFYKDQLEKTGKAPILVPSGGKGSDEMISESMSMHNYLIEHGIPEEHILMEDQSSNTYENMLFSKEKIEAINKDAKVAFSTTNFHVFRSGMLARRVKMRAQGMGSRTKWYFWPNAAVREFVGLLTMHRGKQILILIGLVAVNVAFVFLASVYY